MLWKEVPSGGRVAAPPQHGQQAGGEDKGDDDWQGEGEGGKDKGGPGNS